MMKKNSETEEKTFFFLEGVGSRVQAGFGELLQLHTCAHFRLGRGGGGAMINPPPAFCLI